MPDGEAIRCIRCGVGRPQESSNQTKHAVSFEEAATILLDPFEIAIEDPGHSILNIGYFDWTVFRRTIVG